MKRSNAFRQTTQLTRQNAIKPRIRKIQEECQNTVKIRKHQKRKEKRKTTKVKINVLKTQQRKIIRITENGMLHGNLERKEDDRSNREAEAQSTAFSHHTELLETLDLAIEFILPAQITQSSSSNIGSHLTPDILETRRDPKGNNPLSRVVNLELEIPKPENLLLVTEFSKILFVIGLTGNLVNY